MNIRRFLFGSLVFISLAGLAETPFSAKWKWDDGTIVVETPELPAGQETAVGLTVPKIPVVRVGFVGTGSRGSWAVERVSYIPGLEIVALCDYEEERAERCQQSLKNKGLLPADIYSGPKGYEELCKRPDIDLVYVATDWEHHFPVAKCALENGKNTAIEVPSVMNLEQCWELIDLSEKNRKHCMILENCCYDWFELDALNMAQQGVFGDVIRAQGAYIHTLNPGWDGCWVNPEDDPEKLGWRMKYNAGHRGDIYPTHGLGPVAQALDIHRGDRFTYLTAMDTDSFEGKEYMRSKTGDPNRECLNGDHSTTLMRTSKGKVVEIQHNVMTPQPYNRLYQLTGTKGLANKYPVEGMAIGGTQLKSHGYNPKAENLTAHNFMPQEEMDSLREHFRHPIIKKYGELAAKVGGHGGMDFFMDARLIYCLQNGLPLDMDVYDMAEWCSLAELGALSMDHNSASVAFPDFTRGHWNDVKGFRHAFASEEDERNAESIADNFTARQKEIVKEFDLWNLYDKVKSSEGRERVKAEKSYRKALSKAKEKLRNGK